MPRGEFKTIIASKPVVTKIEQYRKQNSLPSNGQALLALTQQVENQDALVKTLSEILQKIQKAIQDLKTKSGNQYKKTVQMLIELVAIILQALTKSTSK